MMHDLEVGLSTIAFVSYRANGLSAASVHTADIFGHAPFAHQLSLGNDPLPALMRCHVFTSEVFDHCKNKASGSVIIFVFSMSDDR